MPLHKTTTSNMPDLADTKVGSLPDRGLVKNTLKHYGVRLRLRNGAVTDHYYPYCTIDGADVTAYKQRQVANKSFNWHGSSKKAGLFGQHLFSKGGKYVTVCEGEIDTMSVFQMTGSKFPVVGMHNAQAAPKLAKEHFEWLDSFDNIVLCLDNDEPGIEATKKIATLFPSKTKVIRLNKKDAGEYLSNDQGSEFYNLWWRAEKYSPDDIFSGGDEMWALIMKPMAESSFDYPWDALNRVTYGMRTSEFTIITAGSGMGKTQVLREIAHHVLKTTKHNMGLIYLEETDQETGKGMISIELNKPVHLPDTHVTEDEMKQGYDAVWNSGRVHTLRSSWLSNNIDYMSDKIRYFAKGLDCKLIVLDHISFMVSDNSNNDERKALDEIGHKLKALAVELDVHILAVSHAKRQATKPLEEGGSTSLSDLRGTAGLGQLANIVLGLERDGQADDARERNTTLIRVLKNRFSGITGPTSKLFYDQHTGRLTEVDEDFTEAVKDAETDS